MLTSNVRSGFGCERDEALAHGCRQNTRTYNTCVPKERQTHLMGLSKSVRHGDLVDGDLVSLAGGKVVPLNPDLEFAGIIDGVGQDNQGRYFASLVTRGAICVIVHGLSPASKAGTPVYAVPGEKTQTFTVEENTIPVGALLFIEDLASSRAIVGVRLKGDDRPFECGVSRFR